MYCLNYDKTVGILAYLDPSEFSSHMDSAFKCSDLNRSALRSSGRDIARPRRAGRHSGPKPGSPLRPTGRKVCTEVMSKYFVLLCFKGFKCEDVNYVEKIIVIS